MTDPKSVVIKLTNDQRDAIKKATGKDIGELKVEGLEGRVTPLRTFDAEERKAPFRVDEPGETEAARKAPLEIE